MHATHPALTSHALTSHALTSPLPEEVPVDPAAVLGTRIAAPIPIRDRCLPVGAAFEGLLPDAGLVRGRTVGCTGSAAWSLAFALVADAARAGSWVAVVGVAAVGLEAAGELGIPLDRIVVVDADGGASVWAERVAAAADGFEVIVTRPPAGSERVVRRVRQRLQSNGVVLVAVDQAVPSISCDLDLATTDVAWQGLGQGWGHLMARRALVRVSGRRAPRPVERELLLPGPDGRVHLADPGDRAGSVLPLHRAG